MNDKKKKVAIYCVNYQSYDKLDDYLTSIDKAMEKGQDIVSVTVIVADNSEPTLSIEYNPLCFTLKILTTHENMGYFGAVRHAMKIVNPEDFDYSIISNVDVLLAEDFFFQLCDVQLNLSKVGWIAPEIYSLSLGFDFNPQAIARYSLRKLKILRLMFKYPWLLRIKQKLLHKYHNIENIPSGSIYAGHGSFIILTKIYFLQCGIIDYPVFLYGEEIYLAETCRHHQLHVIYEPNIKVVDIGRVSTGKIPSRLYCKYNYQAIDYAIKFFNKDLHGKKKRHTVCF